MFKNVWFFSLLMVGSFFLWGCVSFEWVPSVVGMTGLWVGDCGEWIVVSGLCEKLVRSLRCRDDKFVGRGLC